VSRQTSSTSRVLEYISLSGFFVFVHLRTLVTCDRVGKGEADQGSPRGNCNSHGTEGGQQHTRSEECWLNDRSPEDQGRVPATRSSSPTQRFENELRSSQRNSVGRSWHVIRSGVRVCQRSQYPINLLTRILFDRFIIKHIRRSMHCTSRSISR
jgi:hypothetical protein